MYIQKSLYIHKLKCTYRYTHIYGYIFFTYIDAYNLLVLRGSWCNSHVGSKSTVICHDVQAATRWPSFLLNVVPACPLKVEVEGSAAFDKTGPTCQADMPDLFSRDTNQNW